MKILKLKKVLSIAMAVIMMTTFYPMAAFASDDVKVTLNGMIIKFDQPPIIEKGRTLVPLKAIFVALGAEVDWNGSAQIVTAVKNGTTVVLKIGSDVMTKNNVKITLDVPAKIKGGRTLVPLKAVAESFDTDVKWDANARTVIITENVNAPENINTAKSSDNTANLQVQYDEIIRLFESGLYTEALTILDKLPTDYKDVAKLSQRCQMYIAYKEGTTAKFGNYYWRVLDIQDNKALLLTDKTVENRMYNSAGGSVTWETSDMRKYLNGTFYHSFNEADRNRIAETIVINNSNQWYGTYGGGDTNDKIFLLSIEEIVKYFGDSGQLNNGPDSIWSTKITDGYNSARRASNGSRFLLRSPGESGILVAYVEKDGSIYMQGYYATSFSPPSPLGSDSGGVRPALWLNL